ncbi:metal-dependent hydrolase [Candidatus Micrarchaeota archaeon]|nr:metal-dependent hydrolase [Candidatus Micrarchaeota archaeon]
MNWRSHVLIGIIFAIIAVLILGTRDTITIILFGAIGGLAALVPDLDHDTSKGRQLLDMGFIGFSFLSAYGSKCGSVVCLPNLEQVSGIATIFFALVGVYFVFFKFFKPNHRGITHTILATIVFGVLMYFFAGLGIAVAGIAGYFSHMVADQHIKLI